MLFPKRLSPVACTPSGSRALLACALWVSFPLQPKLPPLREPQALGGLEMKSGLTWPPAEDKTEAGVSPLMGQAIEVPPVPCQWRGSSEPGKPITSKFHMPSLLVFPVLRMGKWRPYPTSWEVVP